MTERIIEITTDGRHVAVDRGFMTVSEKGQEITRIPLDAMAALIGNAHGLTYSNNLLVEFAKRNILFVICGANHTPAAYLWSVDGYHQQAARIDAQLQATLPKSKQLWKQIVESKIEQQAAVLRALGKNDIPVLALAKNIKSGDPDNAEAQAARRYWPLLFGDDFRRDRDAGGINAMLNYAYTILRSTVARSLMAAGLHPSFPIHHKNANNPMRLVDDMMEPFRAYADIKVWMLQHAGYETVTPTTKPLLAEILESEVCTQTGMTSLRTAIQDTMISLAQVYEGGRTNLALPTPSLPLFQATPNLTDNNATIQRTSAHVDDGDV